MMSDRIKTILLIVGVILACLLLLQGLGIGLGESGDQIIEPIGSETTTLKLENLFQLVNIKI